MSRRDSGVPAMMRFPVPPNELPALEALLAGSLWSEWADRGRVFPLEDVCSVVRYVRFKPNVSCRILVLPCASGPAGEPPPGFLLHLYADSVRARTAFEKVSARPTLVGEHGFPPFLSEQHAVVAVPFPNDVEVPGLRHVYVPRRLRRALVRILGQRPGQKLPLDEQATQLTLLAYKPGRRAVFRADPRSRADSVNAGAVAPLHVKVESPKIYPQSHDRLSAVHAATQGRPGWRVPSPVGTDERRWLTASEWVYGQSASVILGDEERAGKMMRLAGRALAGLHRSDPVLAALAAPDDEAARVERLAEDLMSLLPGESVRVETLGARLARSARDLLGGTNATLHGDFHLDQVLRADGCTVLVDLDCARPGHAAIDIGTFRAHLDELGVSDELHEAFLEGYGGPWVAEHRRSVEVATAIGVFRRAVFPFRRLDVDWPSRTRRYLEQTEKYLREAGA